MSPETKVPGSVDLSGTLSRLILRKRDVASQLGCCTRTLERMIATGEIPTPDLTLRRRPAWRASTIEAWVRDGCPKVIDDMRNMRILKGGAEE